MKGRMHWPHVLSMGFLVFISTILWGAWQGWFSRKLPKKVTEQQKTPEDPCKALRQENEQLRSRVFQLENENAALKARIAELQKQLEYLMDQINKLTAELEASRLREADLLARLKAALEDLQACRAALQKCNAQLIAKQIADATCKLTPENANLLR